MISRVQFKKFVFQKNYEVPNSAKPGLNKFQNVDSYLKLTVQKKETSSLMLKILSIIKN